MGGGTRREANCVGKSLGRATIALMIAALAVLLGATVFRDQVAGAAGSVPSFFVSNDSAHPVPVTVQNASTGGTVPVHEQGTPNVNVTNTVAASDVDQRTATRFGPYQAHPDELRELIPRDAVPAGKKFIVSYITILGRSVIPDRLWDDGSCVTWLLIKDFKGDPTALQLGSTPFACQRSSVVQ
jgi:hypothetical protein